MSLQRILMYVHLRFCCAYLIRSINQSINQSIEILKQSRSVFNWAD